MSGRALWLRPAVFGTFDGLTAVLGVLLSLRGHPAWVLPSAAALACAEGVGMAAGEWLSDSQSGPVASAVIGAATAAGSIAPAVPYALFPATWATAASALVLLGLSTAISAARAREVITRPPRYAADGTAVPSPARPRGWPRALAETFGVLLAALLAVAACTALTPGGGS